MSKLEHNQILTEIAMTCKQLRKTGKNLLRYYFQLGALVDKLHKNGVSYRKIVTDLKKGSSGRLDTDPHHTLQR